MSCRTNKRTIQILWLVETKRDLRIVSDGLVAHWNYVSTLLLTQQLNLWFIVDGVTVKNASEGWFSELCVLYTKAVARLPMRQLGFLVRNCATKRHPCLFISVSIASQLAGPSAFVYSQDIHHLIGRASVVSHADSKAPAISQASDDKRCACRIILYRRSGGDISSLLNNSIRCQMLER